MTDLRRCRARPDELAGRRLEGELLFKLAREQLRLVKPTLALPITVQRHCNDVASCQALDDDAFSQQDGERLNHMPPALVLESMNRLFDWAFVGDGGAQTCQRFESVPAAAVVTG